MTILNVFIINKAGGLVFHNDFAPSIPSSCTIDDYLVLASTFQSVHVISSQISPVPGSSGIQTLEAETFKLSCLQTMTGIKFLLLTDHNQPHIDAILKRIYELYADYVMKNPFHTPEMPIKCESFQQKLHHYIRAFSV
jgi:hypothetical protein